MKKRKNILLMGLLLAGCLSPLAAQESSSPEVEREASKAKNNWFVSLGAGPSLLIGEQDADVATEKRIRLGGEVSVGKWFNPNFGMRMQVYGGSMKGFNYDDAFERGGVYTSADRTQERHPSGYPDNLKKVDGDEGPGFWQEFDAMSASIDLMANLTNLFRGYYRDGAVVEVIPYVGLGYQHAFKSNTNPVFRGVVGRLGARVNFNLSNSFAIYLEPQAAVTDAEFDGYIGNRDFDAYFNAMVGVQYNINKNFSSPLALSQGEINTLNDRINEQRELIENQQDILERQQRLLNELKEQPEKNKAIEKQSTTSDASTYVPDYVRFGLNSSAVETSERHKVEDAAAHLKANPGSKLLLIGYADRQTGNSKYNYELSCRRVESVATQLKKMGIDSNRLIIQCVGDKEQPYEQNDWNRVVIMVERK